MPDPNHRPKKISELRNLGSACEVDLNGVGIHTANDLKQLGAEAAFIKLLEGRRKRGANIKCCNAVYLYALYGAIHDIDWRALPDEKKERFKALTAEMRASGRFT